MKVLINTIFRVNVDGEFNYMSVREIELSGLNTVQHKSNGYSHDWTEIVKFCPERDTDLEIKNTVYLTKRPTGRVQGSSTVSFS
jgi:hypothetical protein